MTKVISFARENQCPICNNKLICLERESSVYEVDDEGVLHPFLSGIGIDSIVESTLYCPSCKRSFPATVNNMRIKRNKLSDNDKRKEYNPFYGGLI